VQIEFRDSVSLIEVMVRAAAEFGPQYGKLGRYFKSSRSTQMSKNINKFNFPSVYSGLNGRKAISPI